jgi:hypothetical protein
MVAARGQDDGLTGSAAPRPVPRVPWQTGAAIRGTVRDRTPVIPSHEWSGVVEEADVGSGFWAGDPVIGMVTFDRTGPRPSTS